MLLLSLRPIATAGIVAARTLRPPPRQNLAAVFNNRSGSSTSSSSSNKSGSSKSGGKGANDNNTNKLSFEPPPVKLDPSSNELHRKAARAAQLHEELNSLLDAQAKRRVEELTKPFGSGFVNFLKESKSEMINIFAAFFCVLLAYQISGMRSGARKLLDRAEEREAAVKKLRQLLASLGGNDFAAELAEECSRALTRDGGEIPSGSDGGGTAAAWVWIRGGASVGGDVEANRVAGIIRPIIGRAIGRIVGDMALSDEEMEEKRLADLQKKMGVKAKGSQDRNPKSEPIEGVTSAVQIETNDDALGGMEGLIVALQNGEGNSEDDGEERAKVVKRRKYAGSI